MTRELVTVDFYKIVEEDGIEYVILDEEKTLAKDFTFYRSALTGKVVSMKKLEYLFNVLEDKFLFAQLRTNSIQNVIQRKILQPVVFSECHFIDRV
jgi:hypothetical protein